MLLCEHALFLKETQYFVTLNRVVYPSHIPAADLKSDLSLAIL